MTSRSICAAIAVATITTAAALSGPGGEATSRGGGGSVAWCVRTCDGRYFPLGATG
ncbi:DUF2865 domain-containing protein, partial [Bradyrhizobium sp.]|uniref:DUF2865 domain-containing protein n=1 Tax=Bradyrhizobium sp. TaxID=376 RepID=UPI003919DB94